MAETCPFSETSRCQDRGFRPSRRDRDLKNSVSRHYSSAIYCNYSYGLNVRNVIETALKPLFFAAKSQKSPSGGGLCPMTLSVMRFSCIGLFSTGPKLSNFCAKKFTSVQALSLLANPGCASEPTDRNLDQSQS